MRVLSRALVFIKIKDSQVSHFWGKNIKSCAEVVVQTKVRYLLKSAALLESYADVWNKRKCESAKSVTLSYKGLFRTWLNTALFVTLILKFAMVFHTA